MALVAELFHHYGDPHVLHASTSPRPHVQHMSPDTPALAAEPRDDSVNTPEPKVKVQDLAHIQALFRSRDQSRPQYDISDMPIDSVIEMVAGVLTRITVTNDVQHSHLHKQMPAGESTPVSQQTSSVLAFHGKTVPSITILNYLNRIHKYCPTSYEVFVGLLVYFDRMTDRVNAGPLQALQYASHALADDGDANDLAMVQEATPPLSGESLSWPGSQASKPTTPHAQAFDKTMTGLKAPSITLDGPEVNLAHFFVVDSFNIHRLIIAGVTCASKFFSDIFYTNSRYAKVE